MAHACGAAGYFSAYWDRSHSEHSIPILNTVSYFHQPTPLKAASSSETF